MLRPRYGKYPVPGPLRCSVVLCVIFGGLPDVKAPDARYLPRPFLRSRGRVLELLFRPLLGSGNYHLPSLLRLRFAFSRREASPPFAMAMAGGREAWRCDAPCSSHRLVSPRLFARYVQTRAQEVRRDDR